jgi:hypothetical protein
MGFYKEMNHSIYYIPTDHTGSYCITNANVQIRKYEIESACGRQRLIVKQTGVNTILLVGRQGCERKRAYSKMKQLNCTNAHYL